MMNYIPEEPTTYTEEGMDLLIHILGEMHGMMDAILDTLEAIQDAVVPAATTPDNNA